MAYTNALPTHKFCIWIYFVVAVEKMNKVSKKSKICGKFNNRMGVHRGIQRIVFRERQEVNKLLNNIEQQHSNIIDTEQTLQVQSNEPPKTGISHHSDQLRGWAIRHNVTKRTVNDLLKILREIGLKWLPKDSRSLCKTSRRIELIPIGDGQYWHHGLATNLVRIFAKTDEDMTIKLNFNVDGIPLFKSSGTEFWPILANIHSEFE